MKKYTAEDDAKVINSFVERLQKIGITVELMSNYPWVYLYKVNGKIVEEKYLSKYYYTLLMYPLHKENRLRFSDLSKTFEIIRKYA